MTTDSTLSDLQEYQEFRFTVAVPGESAQTLEPACAHTVAHAQRLLVRAGLWPRGAEILAVRARPVWQSVAE